MRTAGFLGHIRAQYSGYLSLHPSDEGRLADFARQLEEDPLGLLARSTMRGHVTASMMVLDRTVTHAVMVPHLFLGRLLQSGGHIQAMTTVYHSAFSEAVEETGMRGAVPYGPFDADGMSLPIDIDTHAIPANPLRSEGAHVHHDLCFACVAVMPRKPFSEHKGQAPTQILPLEEIAKFDDVRVARLARRVIALRDARHA